MITNRLSASLDSNQPGEQAGFHSSYSTTEYIHVLNQVVEKSFEYNKLICMAFIDYNKAFDSFRISAVIQAIRR